MLVVLNLLQFGVGPDRASPAQRPVALNGDRAVSSTDLVAVRVLMKKKRASNSSPRLNSFTGAGSWLDSSSARNAATSGTTQGDVATAGADGCRALRGPLLSVSSISEVVVLVAQVALG